MSAVSTSEPEPEPARAPSVLLQDRTAIVTGGTRGIGRAIVEAYLDQGASVVFTGRDDRVHQVAAELGKNAVGVVCDGLDEDAVQAVADQVVETHGRIDVLVNNAGIARDAMIHRMTLEAFREVIDVNLQAPWLWCRAVLRHMRTRPGGGAVVNISSISGKAGNLGQSNYSSAKAGLVALTQTVAREGARFGVRSNAIRPGLIETSMSDVIPPETRAQMLDGIPLGRAGTPHEVAQVAVFLASDMASYLTGAVLDVSGGRQM